MHKILAAILTFAAPCFIGMLSSASAASSSPEDRYIAVRDAAIEKISKLYDDNKFDDAAQKAEDAVRADLLEQMSASRAARGSDPPSSISKPSTRATKVLARSTACASIPSLAITAKKPAPMAPTANMLNRRPTSS